MVCNRLRVRTGIIMRMIAMRIMEEEPPVVPCLI